MTRALGIGIIGCGNISATYFKLAPLFRGLEVRACADVNPAAAKARAREFGVKPQTADALLDNPDIDMVINLTVPDAHFAVTKAGLEAGKHVYSEKPLALTIEQGLELRAIAGRVGRRVPHDRGVVIVQLDVAIAAGGEAIARCTSRATRSPARVSAISLTRRSVVLARRSANPSSSSRSTTEVMYEASHVIRSAMSRMRIGPSWSIFNAKPCGGVRS